MDYTGVPAPQLDWDSANLPEAWQRFRQHAELMFTGTYKSKPEEEQCSYLLIWVGDQGRQIYNTWTGLTLANKKLLKTYYDKFEEYVKPKANTTFLRYRFNRRVQGESEKFEQFFTDLKLLANECNFCNVGTCRDERIIERIVFGVRSDRAREKLIEQASDLKLDKAVDFCRTRELSDAQMKSVAQTEATGTVHAVGKKPHKRSGPNRFQTKGHEGQSRAQPAESRVTALGLPDRNVATVDSSTTSLGDVPPAALLVPNVAGRTTGPEFASNSNAPLARIARFTALTASSQTIQMVHAALRLDSMWSLSRLLGAINSHHQIKCSLTSKLATVAKLSTSS